jgi:hypothetical protein
MPPAQRGFLYACGPVEVPSLLDAVVEAGSDLPVIQSVLSAREVIEVMGQVGDVIGEGLVPFALDPSGNPICLSLSDPKVYFCDADLGHTYVVADSLDSLLDAYLALG